MSSGVILENVIRSALPNPLPPKRGAQREAEERQKRKDNRKAQPR